MKRIFYTLLAFSVSFPAFAQLEDDVVINEFVVNPSTGKEYVELLVTGTSVNLQGWTLSDVSTRINATGATEGDFTFPSAPYLASVPRGTYIVVEFSVPTSNISTLVEDSSLADASPRTLILKTTTSGVTLGGTIDNATNDNLHLYAGPRATGALVDQVLAGSNTSYITGATWGDNLSITNTDNVNAGLALSSNSVARFVPMTFDLSGFQNNDAGLLFSVDANSYGTPGAVNNNVNDHSGSLPVALISFSASRSKDVTVLAWTTATEKNSSHFDVQRSIDGKKFETIGSVKGAGNSAKKVNYAFTDAVSLTAKTIYYRLEQVDFDGKSEYSKMVSVHNDAAGKGIGSTLPNPFNNELSVTIDAHNATTATVMIMDMTGKAHHVSTEQLQAGSNKIDVSTVNMPNGIYFVRVTYNGETYTEKVIKK